MLDVPSMEGLDPTPIRDGKEFILERTSVLLALCVCEGERHEFSTELSSTVDASADG